MNVGKTLLIVGSVGGGGFRRTLASPLAAGRAAAAYLPGLAGDHDPDAWLGLVSGCPAAAAIEPRCGCGRIQT